MLRNEKRQCLAGIVSKEDKSKLNNEGTIYADRTYGGFQSRLELQAFVTFTKANNMKKGEEEEISWIL